MMTSEVDKVAKYAEKMLHVADIALPDAYFYSSLPLCALDAVYSIGVRYEAVENVVARYCSFAGVRKCREPRDQIPAAECQEAVSAFLARFATFSADETAAIFGNRQRTSPRNGVLKAEAVIAFLGVLRDHGCELLQDVERFSDSSRLDNALRGVPGQASGVSIKYFWMLAGSDYNVKPDRMIMRFIEVATGRYPSLVQAESLVRGAAELLRSKYPSITPRLLRLRNLESSARSEYLTAGWS